MKFKSLGAANLVSDLPGLGSGATRGTWSLLSGQCLQLHPPTCLPFTICLTSWLQRCPKISPVLARGMFLGTGCDFRRVVKTTYLSIRSTRFRVGEIMRAARMAAAVSDTSCWQTPHTAQQSQQPRACLPWTTSSVQGAVPEERGQPWHFWYSHGSETLPPGNHRTSLYNIYTAWLFWIIQKTS